VYQPPLSCFDGTDNVIAPSGSPEQAASGGVVELRFTQGRDFVVKGQRRGSANQTRKAYDISLASRYLDLQRLRDQVRKAEAHCPAKLEEADRKNQSRDQEACGSEGQADVVEKAQKADQTIQLERRTHFMS
jgi:hypothetical protein